MCVCAERYQRVRENEMRQVFSRGHCVSVTTASLRPPCFELSSFMAEVLVQSRQCGQGSLS